MSRSPPGRGSEGDMRKVGYLISMVGLLLIFTVKIREATNAGATTRRAHSRRTAGPPAMKAAITPAHAIGIRTN